HNLAWLGKLRWIMESSLTKTLAAKHQTSVSKIYRKHRLIITTVDGPRKCLKVSLERKGSTPLVAIFGGLSLRRRIRAVLQDQRLRYAPVRSEVVTRLLAQQCEVCGATEKLEVHHIRKLADLTVKGRREKPVWAKRMAARRRKTLVLCQRCHIELHAGRL